MPFQNAKVYFDGSHYIAIPHTTRKRKKRPKPIEDKITVIQEEDISVETEVSSVLEENEEVLVEEKQTVVEKKIETSIQETYVMTKKELFNELYDKYIDLTKKERKKKIYEEMLPYFEKAEYCEIFVNANFERKLRNLICRRVRMCRKANLAGFNYFCTFTYDDKLHSENSFKKKLKICFRNLCYRKNWKYMGVWERAPKTNRLHFHGLFAIPVGTIPGSLFVKKDYDTKAHKMQESTQSTYFNEKFGRSDFRIITPEENLLGSALAYLMKYIEKTGEPIVYSKNLPQYFLSDILDRDVICTIGQEDKKLLLFDDFLCINEVEIMGSVSPQVIELMEKCN